LTIFVDASAIVAIVRGEPGSDDIESTLGAHVDRRTSGVAIWEAARALGRESDEGTEGGLFEVTRFCTALGITTVPIGSAETAEAVIAHRRYGKGHHPARLNMGDCFAYACARTNNARLLYKGDDFSHTDLA
jgi:ribonuclease VapC